MMQYPNTGVRVLMCYDWVLALTSSDSDRLSVAIHPDPATIPMLSGFYIAGDKRQEVALTTFK